MRHLLLFCLCLSSALFANSPRILGLGSPCLDYIIEVQEHDLDRYGLEKGGWHEVDAKTIAFLTRKENSFQVFSGSCVANTVKGLATIGIPAALTGNIGEDPLGEQIQEIFQQARVTTHFTKTETPTSQIACLITPDGERSFCAFVKAEKEISPEDIQPAYFENVELVHLSGYRLQNGAYMEKALRYAKEAGSVISLDLANASLVKEYRERLWEILPHHVDILFANAEEAYAFTDLEPKEAAYFLKNFCQVAIVKVGEDGCWVCTETEFFHSPGVPAHVVDTTGAGDLFASAFLYAYLQKASLSQCADLGNCAGSAAVERYGAELSSEKWQEILQNSPIAAP